MTKDKPQLTIEEVSQMARETAMRMGSHVPLLVVEGDLDRLLFPITEMAKTHEGRAQQLFIAGLMLARSGEVGVLHQLFFITEAWLSMVEDGKIPETPPSQDPKRKEVLTISHVNLLTGITHLAMLEMKRNEQGELQALEKLNETTSLSEVTTAESPLLSAFVTGFLGLSQEVDD